MIIFENTVTVQASKEEVWKTILKLNERYHELSKNHLSYKCINGTPNRAGAIYKVRQYFRGKILDIKFKLTEIIKEEKIELVAEFPHVLLGFRIALTLKELSEGTSVTEKMEFGFNFPFIGKLLNAGLRIILCSGLPYIKNDHLGRLNGFVNLYKHEVDLVEF